MQIIDIVELPYSDAYTTEGELYFNTELPYFGSELSPCDTIYEVTGYDLSIGDTDDIAETIAKVKFVELHTYKTNKGLKPYIVERYCIADTSVNPTVYVQYMIKRHIPDNACVDNLVFPDGISLCIHALTRDFTSVRHYFPNIIILEGMDYYISIGNKPSFSKRIEQILEYIQNGCYCPPIVSDNSNIQTITDMTDDIINKEIFRLETTMQSIYMADKEIRRTDPVDFRSLTTNCEFDHNEVKRYFNKNNPINTDTNSNNKAILNTLHIGMCISLNNEIAHGDSTVSTLVFIDLINLFYNSSITDLYVVFDNNRTDIKCAVSRYMRITKETINRFIKELYITIKMMDIDIPFDRITIMKTYSDIVLMSWYNQDKLVKQYVLDLSLYPLCTNSLLFT